MDSRIYDGIEYFYLRNQQGGITKILDKDGNVEVEYKYDAWGNILDIEDHSGQEDVSFINEYLYRGYRYESELKLYYLNSRFYNPVVGRFINADGLLGEVGDTHSTNSYSYTTNDPINRVDPSGYKWSWNKIAKVAAVAIITAAIITVTAVYVTPVCPTCSTTIIGGLAGGSAQMISNIAHGNDLMNNVAGAAAGGMMMGLTGNPLQAGFANAMVNQTENIIKNQEISITNLLTETVSYSLLNLFPSTQFSGKTSNKLIDAGLAAFGIDAIGFYATEAIQSYLPQISIQLDYHQIRYVVNGEARWKFSYE